MKVTNAALACKAGKIITGFDAVVREMAGKKHRFIAAFAAYDVSEKTFKELTFFAEKYSRKCSKTDVSSEELEPIFKKKVSVFAVTDENFYKLLLKS